MHKFVPFFDRLQKVTDAAEHPQIQMLRKIAMNRDDQTQAFKIPLTGISSDVFKDLGAELQDTVDFLQCWWHTCDGFA